jgi:prevent-host-death family protein
MGAVGVRELKQHTSEILRRVREQGETVDVTYRGRVVARVIPVEGGPSVRSDWQAFWADWDRLSAEISAEWPEGLSAEDAINDVRRDL